MQLRDYQIRIANWLKHHPKACLSVGMGLGKTASVLHFLDYAKKCHPTMTALIVAPKRVAESVWIQEAEKWRLPIVSDMELVAGPPNRRKAARESGKAVLVVSRDNLKDFVYKKFDILVIDELTSFKSFKAQRTRDLLTIQAGRKIGMTGTFAPNGLLDIYPQLAVLDIAPVDNNAYYAWRGRWFVNINQGRAVPYANWKLRAGVKAEEVVKDFKDDIITLTTREWLNLPKMTEHKIPVTLTEGERRAYDDLQAVLHFEIPDSLEDFTIDAKAKFAKLQTLCSGFVYDEEGKAIRMKGGGSKIQEAVEFCRHAKEEGESVLLFYNYRETAIWFGEVAKASGLTIASPSSSGWLEKWNNRQLDVLVANPASAGHGLNLQYGGHIILWLELTYNYEYFAQANARLHRTGQTSPVQVWRIEAEKTIDGRIYPALTGKARENEAVEDATKETREEMTTAEVLKKFGFDEGWRPKHPMKDYLF